jgi:hypothetical protein
VEAEEALGPFWRQVATAFGSAYLDFLGAWRFRSKTPAKTCLISLDFLGFSRPKRVFSMGYDGFSLEDCSVRFSPKVRGAEAEALVWNCGSAELLMGRA